MFFRRLICSFFSFLFILTAQAQLQKLSGKITNAKNEPLAGVSIQIIGNQGGTISDIEGRFSLSLGQDKKHTLFFSAVGYEAKIVSVASVISAESIRRSPDKNTGEVLKRTPGASIQEGKFIVIRGLADRYNQAMLNGILLTSTEPDRKTFSFDLIPASMIDKPAVTWNNLFPI